MRALIALTAAALLAGCEAPEISTEPDFDVALDDPEETVEPEPTDQPEEPVGDEEPERDPEPEPEPEPEDVAATVGDAITLRGHESDVQMRVTVSDIIDPATLEFAFGDEARHIAVKLDLENVGEAVYDDSPGNMVMIIDGDNQQHMTSFETVEECQEFAGGSVRLAPGDTRSGCITFELGDAQVQAVEVTLESGFAPQTGRWTP